MRRKWQKRCWRGTPKIGCERSGHASRKEDELANHPEKFSASIDCDELLIPPPTRKNFSVSSLAGLSLTLHAAFVLVLLSGSDPDSFQLTYFFGVIKIRRKF